MILMVYKKTQINILIKIYLKIFNVYMLYYTENITKSNLLTILLFSQQNKLTSQA